MRFQVQGSALWCHLTLSLLSLILDEQEERGVSVPVCGGGRSRTQPAYKYQSSRPTCFDFLKARNLVCLSVGNVVCPAENQSLVEVLSYTTTMENKQNKRPGWQLLQS